MATTLDIANLALLKVGAEPISVFPDTTSERGRAVSSAWTTVRREVLRSHSWNSVIERTLLIAYAPEPVFDFAWAYSVPSDCLRVLEVDSVYPWRLENGRIVVDEVPSPTLGASQNFTTSPAASTGVAIGLVSHGYTTGDVLKVTGSLMTELNGRYFQITSFPPNNLVLNGEDGTGRTTGPGGTFTLVTQGSLGVRYLRDFSSGLDGLFDSELESVLATRLAIEIVERVTDSTTKREFLEKEYGILMDEARRNDGEEQSGAEFVEDSWITARY